MPVSLSPTEAFGCFEAFACPLCDDQVFFDTAAILEHLRSSHQAQGVRCSSNGDFPLKLTANSHKITEKTVYVVAVLKKEKRQRSSSSSSSSSSTTATAFAAHIDHHRSTTSSSSYQLALYGIFVHRDDKRGGQTVANMSVMMINKTKQQASASPSFSSSSSPSSSSSTAATTTAVILSPSSPSTPRPRSTDWMINCVLCDSGEEIGWRPHLSRDGFLRSLRRGSDLSLLLSPDSGGKVNINVKSQLVSTSKSENNSNNILSPAPTPPTTKATRAPAPRSSSPSPKHHPPPINIPLPSPSPPSPSPSSSPSNETSDGSARMSPFRRMATLSLIEM